MTEHLVRVGVLGCGNVGAALVGLVASQAKEIEARTGVQLEITRVAVRNLSRSRDVELAPGILTRDTEDVVNDPDIDLVVEVIGGIEPARELITTALANGKPVVTANKELLANVGVELFGAADAAGVDLLFEAAVAGGIPLVRALRESLRGEPITRVMGIVNGTTNFILTKMTEQGAPYGEALAEAQRLGFAERDPTADVEGFDAGAKAAIMATIAFGARVVAGDVYHEGISNLTESDIEVARRLGYVVKLLAIAELDTSGEIAVRVHPAMVPLHHPLASVRESFNAVFVEGAAVGQLMFYGRGAGGLPTASAVLGDVIDAAVNLTKGTHGTLGSFAKARIRPIDETSAEYLLGLEVADQPGVLHAVTGVFARHDVSIRAAEQEGAGVDARLVFITHEAREADIQATVNELRELDVVRQVGGLLRVIGGLRPVRYISTRGRAAELGFADVLLEGLATDGGLYVPAEWPLLPKPDELDAAADYADVARLIMTPFVGDDIAPDDLARMCREAYATFRHPAVVPLVQLDHRQWIAELFHGPTLSFKDVALQLVGRLFDHVLGQRGDHVTIVGATSGDTGSAAIEGVHGCAHVDIVILYPEGGTSEVQRRQMTTVDAPNVRAVAVEGTFDDCQDLVKAMFNDVAFRERMRLSAVNSINWARVMAQVVYYVTTARSLGGPITACVPTGNFGNVFAGWVARRMGTPIEDFVIASNENDILTRFVNDGDMSMATVVPTLSPSMDIQVSSNFERMLWVMNDGDGLRTGEQLVRFRESGVLTVPAETRERWITGAFRAVRSSDVEVLAEIRRVHAETGMLIDPHTATGTIAARRAAGEHPVVTMATAHPAKFPDAVERATGIRPALPDHLADLFERPERTETIPADLAVVEDYVARVSRVG